MSHWCYGPCSPYLHLNIFNNSLCLHWWVLKSDRPAWCPCRRPQLFLISHDIEDVFELADRVGLDKVQKWMDNLYFEYGLQKFKASPILKGLYVPITWAGMWRKDFINMRMA